MSKKWQAAVFIGALIVTFLAQTYLAGVPDEPIIHIEQPHVDMGNIAVGTTVKHVFLIENWGKRDLFIKDAKSSCGCAEPVIKTRTIPPGGKGSIEVSFYSGETKRKISADVVVYSNDPRQEESLLGVRADIVQSLVVRPPRIDYGEIRPLQESKHNAIVWSGDSAPWAITHLRVSNSAFAARVLIDEATTKTVQVVVAPSAEHYGTVLGATLTMETTHPRKSVVEIPLRAEVLSKFRVSPKELLFGIIERDKPAHAVINILCNDEGLLNPLSTAYAGTGAVGFSVSGWQRAESSQSMRIDVSLNSSDSVGEVSGTIVIKTGDTVVPELLVPYFAYFY